MEAFFFKEADAFSNDIKNLLFPMDPGDLHCKPGMTSQASPELHPEARGFSHKGAIGACLDALSAHKAEIKVNLGFFMVKKNGIFP